MPTLTISMLFFMPCGSVDEQASDRKFAQKVEKSVAEYSER